MQAPITSARSGRPFAERYEQALRIATVVLCVIVAGAFEGLRGVAAVLLTRPGMVVRDGVEVQQ